jgi:predicted short-subunit dehydrogenase-like oxidoreductase (DUF2520 family)
MEKQMGKKIVMIGAGNVATHLSAALIKSGNPIIQVFSRSRNSARKLAENLSASWTIQMSEITDRGDLYILAVSDDILPEIAAKLKLQNKLLVHTSGSIGLDVFKESSEYYGVIYPVQTFSKEREIDFSNVPIFVEGNNEASEKSLIELCEKISGSVLKMDSTDRMYLHAAAVFACNFTNHLYHIASEILRKRNLPFELLVPLIHETANKIKSVHPAMAQTGPAIRNDQIVIKKHLDLLSFSPGTSELYQKLSQSIYSLSTNA